MAKSQAALEFLTTYAWAILVVVIAISAFVYFGVLSPGKFLSDRCNFGAELGCTDYSVGSNGMKLRMKNNVGESIIVDSVAVFTEQKILKSCSSSIIGSTWPASQSRDIPIICSFDSTIVLGEKEKFKVKIGYHTSKSSTSFNKYSEGEVYSLVQANPISTSEFSLGISCKDILAQGLSSGDGIYKINPGSGDIDVYCDMTTEDGGWTLAALCKPEGNPLYPNYSPGLPSSNCFSTAQVGQPLSPGSTQTVKLSDVVITSILMSGDNITRANWKQQYRGDIENPTNHWVYNLMLNPSQWTSNGCGPAGKLFRVKYSYGAAWGPVITTANTGCSCASNGWSNTQIDSCGNLGTWIAGCELAPSSYHCCACQTWDERANVTLWIR